MIVLDEKKGINPRLTFCTNCGGDAEELMLIGNQTKVYRCNSCDTIHYGSVYKKECQNCGNENWSFDHDLVDNEKLPASEPCEKCKNVDEEVKNGGVYWKCRDCGSKGAVKADAQLSIDVREKMGISAPDPCGVEFNKDEGCPVCGEK